MWIGIDPGVTGGFALVNGSEAVAEVTPTHDKEDRKTWGNPVDWLAVFKLLRSWKKPGVRAVVEQAQAMPGNGVSSMFKYGATYGGLLTVLQALSIPYTLVRPAVWKAKLLGRDDTEETDKKAKAIAYCRDRWPELSLLRTPRCTTPHDGLADSLCIASYGELYVAPSR